MIGGTAVTVASVVSFVVLLLAAYAASGLLRRSLHRVYRHRALDEGLQHALDLCTSALLFQQKSIIWNRADSTMHSHLAG